MAQLTACQKSQECRACELCGKRIHRPRFDGGACGCPDACGCEVDLDLPAVEEQPPAAPCQACRVCESCNKRINWPRNIGCVCVLDACDACVCGSEIVLPKAKGRRTVECFGFHGGSWPPGSLEHEVPDDEWDVVCTCGAEDAAEVSAADHGAEDGAADHGAEDSAADHGAEDGAHGADGDAAEDGAEDGAEGDAAEHGADGDEHG